MQVQYTNRLCPVRVMDGMRLMGEFQSPAMAHLFIRLMQREQDVELYLRVKRTTWGFKFNKGAWWIGGHWSSYNKRLCVTVLPCLTVWVAFKGGMRP